MHCAPCSTKRGSMPHSRRRASMGNAAARRSTSPSLPRSQRSCVITYSELIAMCEANIDVAVDKSSRDLDLVLERLRSLGTAGRTKLRFALLKAIEGAAENVREAVGALRKTEEDLDRWRTLRAEAVAKAHPLVSELDAKIAELEGDQHLELA